MTPKRSDISVLFASPHALTRELVVKALSRRKHFHVIATTTTAEDAIKAARSRAVDVALIRVTLADGPLSGCAGRERRAAPWGAHAAPPTEPRRLGPRPAARDLASLRLCAAAPITRHRLLSRVPAPGEGKTLP